MTGTGRVKVPSGTTAQRPASPSVGSLRFNTDLGYLENYDGTTWKLVSPPPTPAQVSDQVNTSTGYFHVPVGTIAQRPASPVEGLIRYNSQSDFYEGYVNNSWHKFLTADQGSYTISYIALAGGGGGGGGQGGGGGGGAGQYIASTTNAAVGTVLTFYIGSGGAAGGNGGVGTATSCAGLFSTTGGNGGSISPDQNAGGAGGSSGNGYAGGLGNIRGGGGAGSNGAGGNSPGDAGGVGGVGTNSVITGVSTYYGGGGGGAGGNNAAGGLGGGGQGGFGSSSAGGVNTGGGGGGNIASGANGGSGVVILSMPTVNYTGVHTGSPTVFTSGSNTIVKFTGSGTYTC